MLNSPNDNMNPFDKDDPDCFDFSFALDVLKYGGKVRRKAWKVTDFIFLVPGSEFKVNRDPLLGIYPEGTPIKYNPHIDARFKNETVGTWSPSNDDLLASDWYYA